MALAGYDVQLNDVNPDALEAALGVIGNMVRQLKVENNRNRSDRSPFTDQRTLQIEDLGACDLIIEAATEDERVKQKIFDRLLPHLSQHTILTSNTSSISITRLASRTDRPEKFLIPRRIQFRLCSG